MRRGVQFIAVLGLSIAVGCGGSESGGKSGQGGGSGADKGLVIAFSTSPTNLDSRVGNDNASGRVFDLVYSGLVKVTPEMDYAPDVAEKWEVAPDEKSVTFHLKPNVKFQDGRPLTSKDVKFTYDSLMSEAFETSKKAGYASVASIEAPDPATIIFRLKEPNGGFLDNLTVGIVPEGADTGVFKTKPVGAGPYKVVDFRADERVEFEAFDGWHGGAPKIKKVVIRIIPDATTRALELRKGSVNFAINNIPLDSVAGFEKDADFKIMKKPGSMWQYLAFNMRDPLLKNQKVRSALAHAIDRQKIVKDLLLGYGTVTDTMFGEGHWARGAGLPTYAYDPAKAKALLDEAGYKDPDGDGPRPRFELQFKTSTDVEANQRAEMIQQMLQQVGVKVQIQSNEFATFLDDVQKGKFQMYSLSRNGIADPDFYYVIFHSKSIPPEGQNRGFYVNPKIDQLIEQGRATFDKSKRGVAYSEVQKIAAGELPYISIYHQVNVAIMRKNIDGFVMYPAGFLLSVPQMTMQ